MEGDDKPGSGPGHPGEGESKTSAEPNGSAPTTPPPPWVLEYPALAEAISKLCNDALGPISSSQAAVSEETELESTKDSTTIIENSKILTELPPPPPPTSRLPAYLSDLPSSSPAQRESPSSRQSATRTSQSKMRGSKTPPHTKQAAKSDWVKSPGGTPYFVGNEQETKQPSPAPPAAQRHQKKVVAKASNEAIKSSVAGKAVTKQPSRRELKRSATDKAEAEVSGSASADNNLTTASPAAPIITKSGRQVTKPVIYNPAAVEAPPVRRPAPPRANDRPPLCTSCLRWPSYEGHKMVTCSTCAASWHEDCHLPQIPADKIADDSVQWSCKECIKKKAASSRSRASNNIPGTTSKPANKSAKSASKSLANKSARYAKAFASMYDDSESEDASEVEAPTRRNRRAEPQAGDENDSEAGARPWPQWEARGHDMYSELLSDCTPGARHNMEWYQDHAVTHIVYDDDGREVWRNGVAVDPDAAPMTTESTQTTNAGSQANASQTEGSKETIASQNGTSQADTSSQGNAGSQADAETKATAKAKKNAKSKARAKAKAKAAKSQSNTESQANTPSEVATQADEAVEAPTASEKVDLEKNGDAEKTGDTEKDGST